MSTVISDSKNTKLVRYSPHLLYDFVVFVFFFYIVKIKRLSSSLTIFLAMSGLIKHLSLSGMIAKDRVDCHGD